MPILGKLGYEVPSATSIHYPHVSLLHLKSLELRCSATAQSKVLDYLSLLRTACVSLWFEYEATDTASDDLSPGVHRLWNYLDDPEPLSKCHINPTEFTTISEHEVYTRINLLDPGSPYTEKPELTVNIRGTVYTGSLPSLIARTSTLTLGDVMNWWPSLIPYAKNVESLTVKDPSALSRLTLLQPPKEATTELPFPKLKTLVLCDQRLGHTSYGHHTREQILEYRKLSALLQSRHIETIQIVGGAVSGGVYEHFAERQLNVVWVNVEYLPKNGPETDDEDED
ncbi:hypothetical protein ONZ45_g17872 [Pleurotus djamor]|nr:hypothetical protein ONZ45_g17872 [Pleurotus djamor]